MKKISGLFLLSLLSGSVTLGAYKLLFEGSQKNNTITTLAQENYSRSASFGAENIDFTTAADKAIHTVVHVKNVSRVQISNPILEFFYGQRGGGQMQEQVGTGSGVIISEDGYIVTNNHVIKDADDIEITLNNKRSYKAKLIGTDSKMDIALLKISADEKLPYSTFSDSDNVKVGEWVLAVGNPYNLTSTVTAGIVSAKARNLETNGMQSFLQTDAAVNPGNSGGALVNSSGNLIGINTMISSQTGSYVGYSFAVPSNIARKIIEDIMEFGNVQRGILGVEGRELSGSASKDLGLKISEGFYISNISKNSGAEKSGLKKGDVIIKMDNQKVTTYAELSGYINTKRPKDEIKVVVIRDNETVVIPVILTKSDTLNANIKGIQLENIDATDKKKFRIDYGVKIKDINNERLNAYANDLKNGIILNVDNEKAVDVETVNKIMSNKNDNQSVQLQLITNTGQIIRVII